MAWEFESLFDRKIDLSANDLYADIWKDTPSEILVGRMGYRTRTTVAGARLEAEVFPMYGRMSRALARAAKKNLTREAQEKANQARSIRRHILLAEANFTNKDIFLHLTYTQEPTEERMKKDLKNFFSKVRAIRTKRNMTPLKYIYAAEGGDGCTRAHVHMIISGGIDREELEQIWREKTTGRGGKCRTERLETEDGKAESVIIYMAKELWARGLKGKQKDVNEIAEHIARQPKQKRRWCTSKNLTQPKSRTSDSKCSNARVRRIATGFEFEAKEIMEKVYPGYRFIRCAVYNSSITKGVYIRCVMRRIEEGKLR